MKHPTQEQWMDFLYREMPNPDREEFQHHLKACAECAQQHDTYRSTLKQLRHWHIPPAATPPKNSEWPRLARWAAAAALLITTGFAAGRISAPELDPAVLQAQVAAPLEEKLTRMLAAQVEEAMQLSNERQLATLSARLEAIAQKAEADAAVAEEQFAAAVLALRDRDAALYARLQQLEARRLADHRALREDLEKVALFTDRNMRSAQQQLVQLTSFSQQTQP